MCGGRRLEVVQIFAFIVDSDQKLKAAAATEHAIVKKTPINQPFRCALELKFP